MEQDVRALMQEAWTHVSDTNPNMFAAPESTPDLVYRLAAAVHEALRAQQAVLQQLIDDMSEVRAAQHTDDNQKYEEAAAALVAPDMTAEQPPPPAEEPVRPAP